MWLNAPLRLARGGQVSGLAIGSNKPSAISGQLSAKKEQQAISEEEAISVQLSAKKKQSAVSDQLTENAPA